MPSWHLRRLAALESPRGSFAGAADAIDGLVRRIRAAWPGTEVPLVIATGGFAEAFRQLCTTFDVVDPYLTLTGLDMAFELLTAE